MGRGMTCEQCTSLPESAADYSQTSFWDIPQSSPLSGSHTPAKSSENEQRKDGSPTCECGKGMSECSIHPSTPEKWIASMRGCLASLIQSPAYRQALRTREAAKCGPRLSVSFAQFDQNTSFWKTYRDLFDSDFHQYLPIFPQSGMTLNGYAYQLPVLALHTNEKDCGGLLPTPSGTSNHGKNHVSGRLDEWGGSSNPWRGTEIGKVHCAAFEEWMLGLPIMWTGLTEYATRKSHCKPPLHGDCSEASK